MAQNPLMWWLLLTFKVNQSERDIVQVSLTTQNLVINQSKANVFRIPFQVPSLDI